MEGRSLANFGACVNAMGAREQTFNPKYDSETGIFTTDVFAKSEHSFIDMKWNATVPDSNQIEQINDYVAEGLKQGALGVGVAVGYMTAGVIPAETTAWQRLAGEYGRATYVHGRYSSQRPPETGLLGFEEILANAAAFGNGVYFHHMHQQARHDTVAALELVDRLSAAGVRAIGEIYPYNFGASICGADYLKPDNYGPNMGRSYKDIVETATLKPLTKKRYDTLVETAPGTSIMFYGSTDDDMDAGLTHPTSVIGSDSLPMTVSATGELARDWELGFDEIQGHPRAAGTAGIMLRRVREEKLMPLMTAVSKMTYLFAKWLQDNGGPQMAYKCRIQLGADADMVVFDPKTVRDNSTMQQGGLPTTGMPYVSKMFERLECPSLSADQRIRPLCRSARAAAHPTAPAAAPPATDACHRYGAERPADHVDEQARRPGGRRELTVGDLYRITHVAAAEHGLAEHDDDVVDRILLEDRQQRVRRVLREVVVADTPGREELLGRDVPGQPLGPIGEEQRGRRHPTKCDVAGIDVESTRRLSENVLHVRRFGVVQRGEVVLVGHEVSVHRVNRSKAGGILFVGVAPPQTWIQRRLHRVSAKAQKRRCDGAESSGCSRSSPCWRFGSRRSQVTMNIDRRW